MRRLVSVLLAATFLIVSPSSAAKLKILEKNVKNGFGMKTKVDFPINFYGQHFNAFYVEWRSGLISFDERSQYDTDVVTTFPNPAYKPSANSPNHIDTPLIAAYYANAKTFHGITITVVDDKYTNDDAAEVKQWCRDLVVTNVPKADSFKCDRFALVTWSGSAPGGRFENVTVSQFIL